MKPIEHRSDGLLSFPGLIDCHVHFREPGLTQKGDMESESRAALAGGVTTVCEMPNTVPPTVTVEAFRDKVKRAERIKDCDIRFFFGVTKEEHIAELRKLLSFESESHGFRLRDKCCGVKLYLDHSTGDQKIDAAIIEDAFRACAELDLPVVVHAEDATINEAESRKLENRKDVAVHSLMRPPESEARAVQFVTELTRRTGARLHIAHLSTKEGLEIVRKAKRDGLPVSCEVAPHHLFLTVDDYAALGTLAKMNPPLRTRDHQEALWNGILDETVDCIATDHAPHTLEEKSTDDPLKAPSGVPGVETMLPLLLTVASGHWPHPSYAKSHSSFVIRHSDIVRLCFENPNRIFRLGRTPGHPRIVIDPNAEWIIRGKELHSKCQWTPYEGWKVKGRVIA